MKLFVIFISLIVVANALTYIPSPKRVSRDISELQNQYLAPNTAVLFSENLQDSAVLAKDDYKYQTVSKLHFNKRRDVSHLDLAYLPPAPTEIKEQKQPENNISTPVDLKPSKLPSNEYLPPVDESKVAKVITEAPQLSNEYLPPVAETKEAKDIDQSQQPVNAYLPPVIEAKETAAVTTQTPSNDYLAPIQMETDNSRDSEQPTFVKSTANIDAPTEIPQDSAVLEPDGYHYKVPANKPNLFPTLSPTTEYLPPLTNSIIDEKDPVNEKSAALENNGYYYRSIKHGF